MTKQELRTQVTQDLYNHMRNASFGPTGGFDDLDLENYKILWCEQFLELKAHFKSNTRRPGA